MVGEENAFKSYQLFPWSLAIRDGLLGEGTKISASTFDSKGKRHTTTDLVKSANPNNIGVLLNATVNRIVFNSLKKIEENKIWSRELTLLSITNHLNNITLEKLLTND